MKAKDELKSGSIAAQIAQMLADMMERGYARIDDEWAMRAVNGSKIVDEGTITMRRGRDGSFLIRITDKYTGK